MKEKIIHQELRETATYKKKLTEAAEGLSERIEKRVYQLLFNFGGCFY